MGQGFCCGLGTGEAAGRIGACAPSVVHVSPETNSGQSCELHTSSRHFSVPKNYIHCCKNPPILVSINPSIYYIDTNININTPFTGT